MSIPTRLTDYLAQQGSRFEVCMHRYSHSSAETARSAHVRPAQLAKSVLLEDERGYLLAVLPADKLVMLGELSALLDRRGLHLADEDSISTLLPDCEPGALPAVGMAWGIETVVDEELEDNPVVYVEGGDHERLLKMSREQFHTLMSAAHHGRFCRVSWH
ncbi:aminoacyl-tRNA deacylase [Paucibacter soli]|uniref:aminoacyl-tRNA deacylase n=1 Tax=Paucibacter soli TaxID=3133433 RepID=UPI0030A70D74